RHSVPVGEHERFVVHPPSEPLDPAPRVGLLPRVHQVELPGRLISLVDDGAALDQIDRDVVVECVEVEEILLDDLALVSQRNDELVHALGRIDVHDVPEDRLASDLHHRLGLEDRLFRESGPQPAGQDHRLHRATSSGTVGDPSAAEGSNSVVHSNFGRTTPAIFPPQSPRAVSPSRGSTTWNATAPVSANWTTPESRRAMAASNVNIPSPRRFPGTHALVRYRPTGRRRCRHSLSRSNTENAATPSSWFQTVKFIQRA